MGEYLPGVPLAHNPAAIVVASNVQGLVPSPLTDERFVSVSKTESHPSERPPGLRGSGWPLRLWHHRPPPHGQESPRCQLPAHP